MFLSLIVVQYATGKGEKQNSTEMEKKNIGNLLALYPKPMTVVGAEVEGKVNWLVVGRDMLPKADYMGSMSGASVDKSGVFDFHWGENGTPVIDASPLTMECDVNQ